jgi:hypothetical protein
MSRFLARLTGVLLMGAVLGAAAGAAAGALAAGVGALTMTPTADGGSNVVAFGMLAIALLTGAGALLGAFVAWRRARPVAPAAQGTTDLPERVMGEVLWSFNSAPFADRAAFDARVRQYQIMIRKEDTWQPGRVVLPCGRIRLGYTCRQGGEQVFPVVELTSDDGTSFTAGELLFKVHNAVVEQVREIDHRYFEGLSLTGRPAPGEVPLYHLLQGS